MLNPGELLIGAHNFQQHQQPPTGQGMGLVPRIWSAHPCGSMAGAPQSTITPIPRSEWPERIKEQTAQKARLSDIRARGDNGNPIKSRDQDGYGYCWCHSTVSCAILHRAAANQPYADLSAFHIGCIIKGYRNQGGWNGESMEMLRTKGCATSKTWPQQSTSKSNDKPEMWEEAKSYLMTEWDDIPEGDFDRQITYSLMGIPYALDLNWWSHSIAGADAVDGTASFNASRCRTASGRLQTVQEFDAEWEVADFGAAFGARIWNSWSDSWSDNGMGVLTESKARNNGAIALRVMRAAAA